MTIHTTSLLAALLLFVGGAIVRGGDSPGKDAESPEQSVSGAEILTRLAEQAGREGWRDLTFGELVGTIGMNLRGTPYAAGTLEGTTEVCRVDLKGLDCVTFFETSLGIARILARGEELAADRLLEEITLMRYRGGTVEGYPSRLHYFVDWVADNQQKGIVTDVTPSLPHAVPDTRTIDFMSTHTDAYAALKNDAANRKRIVAIEREINARDRYWVPKRYIGETEKNLRTGDIVGITTSISGLDVSHTGLCYRDEKGRLRLLHASVTKKEVVLDTDLHAYLAANRSQTGIVVVRPTAPETHSSSE